MKYIKLINVLYGMYDYSIKLYLNEYIEVLGSMLEDDFSHRKDIDRIYKRLTFFCGNVKHAKRAFSQEEANMITDDVLWLLDNAKYFVDDLEKDYHLKKDCDLKN